MNGKFDGVPNDPDTLIYLQRETRLDRFDVLYQRWFWEGIKAESLIFRNEDVGELSDDEILQQVRSAPICRPDSDVTLKRSPSGYTFVNFNFTAV